ncbi:hypothetical protein ABZQ65_33550 [Pseudomonas aeruginosa]|nr:hypothetical protein [Pseudomonas aeruginosa]MBG6722968.1 hypothetical protein [Pseudomonas aeruginosa]
MSIQVNREAIIEASAPLRDAYPALGDGQFVAAYSVIRELADESDMSMANVVSLLNAGAFVSRSFVSGTSVLRVRPELAEGEAQEVRELVGGYAAAHVAQLLLAQEGTQAFADRVMATALHQVLQGADATIAVPSDELEDLNEVEPELLGSCLRAMATVADQARLELSVALGMLMRGQASYSSPTAALERVVARELPGMTRGDYQPLVERSVAYLTDHKDELVDTLLGEMIDEWAENHLPDAIMRARMYFAEQGEEFDEGMGDDAVLPAELLEHQGAAAQDDLDDEWLNDGGFSLDR